MAEPLHVAVWGDSPHGPCAYYRGSLFAEVLAEVGVTLRQVQMQTRLTIDGPDGPITEMGENALRQGLQAGTHKINVDIDLEPIEWADVLLFRRDYNTSYACSLDVGQCAFRTEDRAEAAKHQHRLAQVKDTATLPIWTALMQDPNRPAIVYDTDDYLIGDKKMMWNGLWADYYSHRHLCREMARKADLVTVTTPTLASMYAPTNRNIRVIRNAIDPAIYQTDTVRPVRAKPTMLYYGSAVRMRDFGGYPDDMGKIQGGFAYKAVLELKREVGTMFLGAEPGSEKTVKEFAFDEVRPRVVGIQAFAQALAETHADIGIAPLYGDEFDAAKSELHWLEYSMIGAATIADKMNGRGPYSPIRDGVDGFLVRGRQQWYDSLKRLTRETNMREDMAAAAKERVLSEYDYRKRALEWKSAFLWASEHRGIGA